MYKVLTIKQTEALRATVEKANALLAELHTALVDEAPAAAPKQKRTYKRRVPAEVAPAAPAPERKKPGRKPKAVAAEAAADPGV